MDISTAQLQIVQIGAVLQAHQVQCKKAVIAEHGFELSDFEPPVYGWAYELLQQKLNAHVIETGELRLRVQFRAADTLAADLAIRVCEPDAAPLAAAEAQALKFLAELLGCAPLPSAAAATTRPAP